MEKREKFGSFGALMAMAGSAVGLGNMWRFPYLVGENGGAAFIIVYILCAVLIALPMFFAEFIIGRRSGANCFGALKKLAPGSKWKYLGLINILTPAIVLSYYCVIGGWSIQYLLKACSFEFSHTATQAELATVFSNLVQSVWAPLFGFLLFLGLSAFIVGKGVKKGIESFGKVAMPALFFIIIAIAVYVAFLPGAVEGYRYLFEPDFSELDGKAVLAALGQSFFSMSLGCGCILTYASYVKKSDSLLHHCTRTTFIDLGFALISGCAIMPAVFSFGVDPASGPSLVYETLPFIFSKMPGGNVIAIVFFTALIVAALTSAISLYEVVTVFLVEERHRSRKSAVLITLANTLVIGALCSLSFGPLSDVKLFGRIFFELCDEFASDVLMIVGSLLLVLFVGWKMKRADVYDEFIGGGANPGNDKFFPVAYFLIRYIAPAAILAIFITGLVY